MWYRDVSLRGTAVLIVLMVSAFGAAVRVDWAAAQTIVVPTLTVSETYDSNVFFTPKQLLSPGTKPEDFITNIVPQVTLGGMGQQIQGNFSLGALVTRYINNPDLDYTGINATGLLDVSRWAKRYSQRITNLSLRGLYTFTPNINAFGTVGGGQYGAGYGSNYGAYGLGTGLNSGLITNRVQMHNVNVGVSSGYQLTRTASISGSYSYTMIFFGNQDGVNNQLFNTIGNSGTITFSKLVSWRDTVGTTATISHYEQSQSNGSGQGSFTTPTGTANWNRRWTPQLSTNLSAGAMVLLPIDSTVPGQGTRTQFAPTGTIGLFYTSFSEALRSAGSDLGAAGPAVGATGSYGAFSGSPLGAFGGLPTAMGSLSPGTIVQPGQYTTSLTYNYSYYPSYAFGAGATRTHVIGANMYGGLTSKLTGQMGLNFAHGSSAASSTSFSYETIGVTLGARYLFGPILASLTGNWLYSSNSSSDVTGSSDTAFSKKSILLALSYAFTNQSFFKMDRFGYVGPREGGEGPGLPSEGAGESAPATSAPKN